MISHFWVIKVMVVLRDGAVADVKLVAMYNEKRNVYKSYIYGFKVLAIQVLMRQRAWIAVCKFMIMMVQE